MKFFKIPHLFCWMLGCITAASVAAQNNPIFSGGIGRGATTAIIQAPSVDQFYVGGTGDGYASLQSARPLVDSFFAGGTGDGWNFASANPIAIDNIFTGGNGDGWTQLIIAPPPVDTFYADGSGDGWMAGLTAAPLVDTFFGGGQGDGWNSNTYLVFGKDTIFRGGRGDGWAANFIPLIPLPVRLLSFTGVQRNKQHLLQWQTSQEINSAYFVVERSTTNGNFIPIGTVPAAGNSTGARNYELLDVQPLPGNNLYRLKQVDLDGRFAYSNTVILRLLQDQGLLSIFPNPTTQTLHLQLNGALDGSLIYLEMTNGAGQSIVKKQLKKTNSVIDIDVRNLPAGVYHLQVIENNKPTVFHFVKQ